MKSFARWKLLALACGIFFCGRLSEASPIYPVIRLMPGERKMRNVTFTEDQQSLLFGAISCGLLWRGRNASSY